MAETSKTKTKTAPKKPADHKAPEPRFSDVPGHDLLKPFSQVRGADQARLTARLVDLGVLDDDGEETGSILDLDLEAVADFIDYVSERFAIDPEAFDEFTMGHGGMERALNLALAYAGELGKGVN